MGLSGSPQQRRMSPLQRRELVSQRVSASTEDVSATTEGARFPAGLRNNGGFHRDDGGNNKRILPLCGLRKMAADEKIQKPQRRR